MFPPMPEMEKRGRDGLTPSERRRQNQIAWANSPNNSSNRVARQIQAAKAARLNIAAEVVSDANGSASLHRLRRIMGSPDIQLYRRMDAAEIILGYELAPGAVAGADPDEISAGSYRFLKAVIDDPETPEALEFRALKCIAQVENARAQIRNAGEQLGMKRALFVELVNAERRHTLIAAGKWPASGPWCLETSDTFVWSADWPGLWGWPPRAIGAAYKPDSRDAFRTMLRSVRATNRDDDWDKK
jgi:hypothetical protein